MNLQLAPELTTITEITRPLVLGAAGVHIGVLKTCEFERLKYEGAPSKDAVILGISRPTLRLAEKLDARLTSAHGVGDGPADVQPSVDLASDMGATLQPPVHAAIGGMGAVFNTDYGMPRESAQPPISAEKYLSR